MNADTLTVRELREALEELERQGYSDCLVYSRGPELEKPEILPCYGFTVTTAIIV